MAGRMLITQQDFDTMLRIVADVEADVSELIPYSVLTGLLEIIPCDNVSFVGYDPHRRETHFDQEVGDPGPTGEALEAFHTGLWTNYRDFPPFYRPDMSPDCPQAMTMSDFLSRRQMRDTAMYQDCLRLEQIEQVLMLCLPHEPGRVVRVHFFRSSGPEFSHRDRGLLTLLRPHLDKAYRDQRRRRRTIPALTVRQWQLLHLVAAGHTNGQIARRMSITEATVRKHLEHTFQRLRVTSRAAAVMCAFGDSQPGHDRSASGATVDS
jgi:DNA-binding CsgD family transcriptional regulator